MLHMYVLNVFDIFILYQSFWIKTMVSSVSLKVRQLYILGRSWTFCKKVEKQNLDILKDYFNM